MENEQFKREICKEGEKKYKTGEWVDITMDCTIKGPLEWGAEGVYGFNVYYKGKNIVCFSNGWEDAKEGFRLLENPDTYYGFRIEKED